MKIIIANDINLNGRRKLSEREKDMLGTALYTMVRRNAEQFGMQPEMEHEEFIETTFCNDNIVSSEEGVFIEYNGAVISIEGLFALKTFDGIFGIANNIETREQNIVKIEL